jgi:hypothetical protein
LGSIEEIVRVTDFNDESSVALAHEKMKEVSDFDIERVIVIGDTNTTLAPRTRKCVSLARRERDRRVSGEQRELALRTTGISGRYAIVASLLSALVGAILGAALTYYLQNMGN